MPSPKDGTPGSLVAPAAPEVAKDADVADPGQVETVKAGERQTKTGKYGTTPVKPYKKPTTPEEKKQKPSWIEVVLVDDQGNPVPGEKYRVTLPDQSVSEGTLNDKGVGRVDGFEPGSCKITFPDMDQDLWSPG